jgi:two-component system, chemotaxis family, CheB/CheR fusion protein
MERAGASGSAVPQTRGTGVGIWGARVLFVGDGGEILEAAARVLRGRGADVILVPGAGAALATVIGVVPDVMVVDITLPAHDSIGFVRAVRSLSPEKGGQVPVLTLSAAPLAGNRLQAWHEAGLQGHFQKPFDPLDLAALVDQLAGLAVERRHRALDRSHWPRDVSRDRRLEIRGFR